MELLIPSLENISSILDRYKDSYDISFSRKDELPEVIDFINTHWKKNHILTLSSELMKWQHYDATLDRYNFVIARNKRTKSIDALLGFITTKTFDNLIEKTLLWGAIWKVREDLSANGLGLSLYLFLIRNIDIDVLCLSGISDIARNIYKSLNFHVGLESHYFIPCVKRREFKIAEGIEKIEYQVKKDTEGWNLRNLTQEEFSSCEGNQELCINQFKTIKYFINRYFKHPMYKYECIGITKNGVVKSVLFVRRCDVNDSSCLRIVEYIGDYSYIGKVLTSIQEYLINNELEYIDLVIYGIEGSVLKNAGLLDRRDYDDLIIPNYFEPFLRKNIDIGYAFIAKDEYNDIIITKGDADQDRPSILVKGEK